jgi:hypothetical protein
MAENVERAEVGAVGARLDTKLRRCLERVYADAALSYSANGWIR